jgi:glycyl-tRNA synthetase
MFIVKKKISGKDYFYARESKREGKKVKAVTVAYLGKTKKEAAQNLEQLIIKRKSTQNSSEDKFKNSLNKSKDMSKEKIIIQEQKKEIKPLSIEDLSSFCKRKGLVFKSSEIYGGLAGFWDYGPLGTELFNNIKQDFWKFFVHNKDNMTGIDASIISHPKTWQASGHIASFSDVAVVCKKCKKATKLDKSEVGKVKCDCGGDYESQGEFGLMFKTNIGALNPLESYLRPETAQGMFLDFKQVYETSRMKLPFGILQIGKCFRNEIAPRDFIFRSREFTIGEFEFFIHPEDDKCDLLDDKHLNLKIRLLDKETQDLGKSELREITIGKMIKEKRLGNWHAYWLAEQLLWFEKLGLLNKTKIREHMKSELSHYSSATFDLDYEYPFGSVEVGGNANRGQYDLTQHAKFSSEKMEIFDEITKSKIIPRVIEPTFGIDRIFLALICNGYEYDEKRQNIVLKLPNYLAPVKAAIFPIIKGDEFEKTAKEIYQDLKKEINVIYDTGGSLGRRYSRQDEIGTPYCITIDGDSEKDKSVTIRDRNTTKQVRVKIKDLKEIIRKLIFNEIEFEKAGKLVETRVKE